MPSRTPQELIDTMRTFFVQSRSPTTAWGNVMSLYLSLPALRAYYPFSATRWTGSVNYISELANGYELTNIVGNPQLWRYSMLGSCMYFGGGGALARSGDDAQFDIIGNEAYVYNGDRGLTVGGWFHPVNINSTWQGLITKWYISDPTFEGAYALNIDNNNAMRFGVSGNGSTGYAIASSTVSQDNWYFVVGRYDADAENSGATPRISIVLNDVIAHNATSIPSALYDSTEPFTLGRYNRTDYYTGHMAHVFVCACQLPTNYLLALFHHTRALFGV